MNFKEIGLSVENQSITKSQYYTNIRVRSGGRRMLCIQSNGQQSIYSGNCRCLWHSRCIPESRYLKSLSGNLCICWHTHILVTVCAGLRVCNHKDTHVRLWSVIFACNTIAVIFTLLQTLEFTRPLHVLDYSAIPCWLFI